MNHSPTILQCNFHIFTNQAGFPHLCILLVVVFHKVFIHTSFSRLKKHSWKNLMLGYTLIFTILITRWWITLKICFMSPVFAIVSFRFIFGVAFTIISVSFFPCFLLSLFLTFCTFCTIPFRCYYVYKMHKNTLNLYNVNIHAYSI